MPYRAANRSPGNWLSWGASLALELYRRHPTAVRTLILVSAYAGWAGSWLAA
jgi:pimeloyl-ACP methyl ester carboxylesterase